MSSGSVGILFFLNIIYGKMAFPHLRPALTYEQFFYLVCLLFFVSGPESSAESKWLVSTEGRVLCEGSSFLTGLSVLFACYYVFKLEYQDDSSSTLEFIQR